MAPINDSYPFEKPRIVESPADCHFYHVMDLPEFGTTEGRWDLRGKFEDYTGNVDFNARTVLDIGSATGFLSFEAEQRGARVVSFDISHGKYQTLLPFIHKKYYLDHEVWAEENTAFFERWKNGYWFAHRLLKSQARVFYGNIHDLPTTVGRFDIVIVGSILEHLNDQISALTSISRLTESTMVINTPLWETEDPVAGFMGRADTPEQDITWWTYSIGTYRHVLKMLGFDIARIHAADYFQVSRNAEARRFTIVAERVAPLPTL